MEGPSLKILEDELAPFLGKKIVAVDTTTTLDRDLFLGKTLKEVRSWGKHLLLHIGSSWFRVHFLMFGSYRIDAAREGRTAKLSLHFARGKVIHIYSSAIGLLIESPDSLYDWRLDVLSDLWDPKFAVKKLLAKPKAEVCDVLMDQEIFAGVGNIIKNEVLFRLKIPPDRLISAFTTRHLNALAKETRVYCEQFMAWKRQGQLKKNWQVFRKKNCPVCGGKITKKSTGVLLRVSHFCPECQN